MALPELCFLLEQQWEDQSIQIDHLYNKVLRNLRFLMLFFFPSFREEIEYIMMCVDTNQDGKVDFLEFTDRFHNPAKDIGFNVAVLLTNLSEHMPNDPRSVSKSLSEFDNAYNSISLSYLFIENVT